MRFSSLYHSHVFISVLVVALLSGCKETNPAQDAKTDSLNGLDAKTEVSKDALSPALQSTVTSVTLIEGEAKSFDFSLKNKLPQPTEYTWMIANGENDFVAAKGTVVLNKGAETLSFQIQALDDLIVEGNEQFVLSITEYRLHGNGSDKTKLSDISVTISVEDKAAPPVVVISPPVVVPPAPPVVVVPVNNAPQANNESGIYINQNQSVTIDVLANDTDPDGDAMHVTTVGAPAQGSVQINSDSSITYSPNANSSGQDQFSYTVSDSNGDTATALVIINVMTPFTWTGNFGDGNWTSFGNWCGSVTNNACVGGAAPSSSDIAVFDGTCTSCHANINANVAVKGMRLNSGYVGTLTQQDNFTIAVGISHWNQYSGSFVGGNAKIKMQRELNLYGGSFTSTSGLMELGYDAGSGTFYDLRIAAGAQFLHHSGIVRFVSSATSGGGSYKHLIDIANQVEFNHVEIKEGGFSSALALEVVSGGVVLVKGNLTHDSTQMIKGQWHLHGNLKVGNNSRRSSSADIVFNGSGNQEYESGSGYTGNIIVNKSTGVVSSAASNTNLNIAAFKMISGVFIAPTGRLRVGTDKPQGTYDLFVVQSGAQFSHNSGTVVFEPDASSGGGSYIHRIDVDGTLTLNNVEIKGGSFSAALVVEVVQGDAINALGNFTHDSTQAIAGNWHIKGNLLIGSNSRLSPYANLILDGTGNQEYSCGTGGTGGLTINKASGTVSSAVGNANLNVADFKLLAGTFIAPTGSLKVGADKPQGSYDLFVIQPGASFQHNNGRVVMRPTATSGGGSYVHRINVDGTVTFHDLEMAGGGFSAALTIVLSSEDTAVVEGSFAHTGQYYSGNIVIQNP